jgi:hypothetical protein
MRDRGLQAALQRHWAASDSNDFAAEHEIYEDDAVLECPQFGERIRGRRGIEGSRMAQPKRNGSPSDVCRVRPVDGTNGLRNVSGD